jgi:hypothetical protein
MLFLLYTIEAEIFSTALFAMSAFPDGIEVTHRCINEAGFVG